MPLQLAECWLCPIAPAPWQVIDAHCLPGRARLQPVRDAGEASTHGGYGCDARHERRVTGYRLQLG